MSYIELTTVETLFERDLEPTVSLMNLLHVEIPSIFLRRLSLPPPTSFDGSTCGGLEQRLAKSHNMNWVSGNKGKEGKCALA